MSMMGASNMLNSIKSYTLTNINADIMTVSAFTSVPFNGQPNNANDQTPEFEPKYIVCGKSKCGTESGGTGEICGH